ncbi:F-box/LRR-repeat protein 6-like, partial [Pseudonaja textilis]|uniref:F-box/LRR-repeat protein 6-like n=1 Tax=Pseudonaja textilis TaxID=8673 RepID=UPI000EA9A2E9
PPHPSPLPQGGCCPDLRLLEVNAEIKQCTQHFQLPIEQLQAACPQLQVLRLLNVTYYPKQLPASSPPSLGFPQLEELCLATTAFSFVDNHMLWRILSASSRLRVLDLRGCVRVTPKGLERLTCPGGCRRGGSPVSGQRVRFSSPLLSLQPHTGGGGSGCGKTAPPPRRLLFPAKAAEGETRSNRRKLGLARPPPGRAERRSPSWHRAWQDRSARVPA